MTNNGQNIVSMLITSEWKAKTFIFIVEKGEKMKSKGTQKGNLN